MNNKFGEGIPFERIRRITGYIVGDYKSRFNDAKRKECEDRVKHNKLYSENEYEEKDIRKDSIQEKES